jgi:hypothetical protein
MEAMPDLFRKRHRFRVAENLNGLSGGINDEPTVPAAGKMLFEVGSHGGVEAFLEIT